MYGAGGLVVFATILAIASCEQCPQVCDLIWDPVCDGNGRVYPNQCELMKAVCKSGGDVAPVMCTMEYRPVCGSNGRTYSNQCQLEAASCMNVVKVSDGECPSSPRRKRESDRCLLACPDNYDPVCGTDGELYANECELRVKACETDFAVSPIACPRHLYPVCGSDGNIYDNSCVLLSEACKGIRQVDMSLCEGNP